MAVDPAAQALLTLGGVSLAAGLAFAAVARSIPRPAASEGATTARHLLTLGWGALAGAGIVGGLAALLAAADPGGARAPIGVTLHLTALLLPLASWGFVGHVLFLVRGDHKTLRASALLHGILAILFTTIVVQVGEARLLTAEGLRVVFERQPGPWLTASALAVASLPLATLFGCYIAILPRLQDRAARRRAVLVALALFTALAGRWTTASIVQGAEVSSTLLATHALFGLAPPALLLAAYRAPKKRG